MLFDISLNRGFGLIRFLQDHLIWLSFTRVYVIADVLLLKTKMSNSRWHPTALLAGSRPSFLPRTQNFHQPPTIQYSAFREKRQREHAIKTLGAPANKTSPPFNYAQPDLTWAIHLKMCFMQEPNHWIFFFSIRGTNHRFPTLSFYSPAAVKLLRLLTFGIIPDSLWTFLSRCQLLWNVLRGSGSTPVAAAVV